MNYHFTPKAGNKICPKCFGETEIDLTPRDASGWPIGPCQRRTCDHCEGEGEIEITKPNTPNNLTNPENEPKGWAIFNQR